MVVDGPLADRERVRDRSVRAPLGDQERDLRLSERQPAGAHDPLRRERGGIRGRDGRRVLQVYWLAARVAGTPLENPRQVAAYRYPRQYGPQSPTFARAMLPPAGSDMPLLLSGTASVVGHETRHPGDVLAQLDETFANLDSLLDIASLGRVGLAIHVLAPLTVRSEESILFRLLA